MEYKVPVKGWPLGVDNIQPDFDIAQGTLRAASNVDIFDGGKIKLRGGATVRTAITGGATSLWSHPSLSVGYYAAGGSIYSYTAAGVSTAVVTGLSSALPVAFHYIEGDVFWTNSQVNGRIRAGVNTPWGVETPASQPVLAATTGTLLAGTYQLAVTYKTLAGEESGAQNSVSATLAAAGGVSITAIPVPVSATVTSKCIYMTLANGDVHYRIATIPAAQTTMTVATPVTPGSVLRTQDFSPMPAGNLIAHRNGIVFVASGPYVFYSEPFRYGLHDPAENFYAYPADVTVMLSTPEGLYVVADKSYFIANPGLTDVEQKEILPFGAASGTGLYMPEKNSVAWFSTRGQVVASGGQAEVITEKHFTPAIMAAGASFVKENQGLRQIVNVARQSSTNPYEYTGA